MVWFIIFDPEINSLVIWLIRLMTNPELNHFSKEELIQLDRKSVV